MPDSLLGPRAHDRDIVQPEVVNDFLEPDHPPFERLNKSEFQIRTGYGKAETRQSGAASDVGHMASLSNLALDDSAVQHVPPPQSRYFPRTDESALGSRCGQVLDVPFRQGQTVAENLFRRLALGSRNFYHQ